MEIKIYANYGVLAHEKEPVYTINPINKDLADEITVIIPEELKPYTAEDGNVIVTLSNMKYIVTEVLTNRGEDPVLAWFDGANHWKKLTVKA